MVKMVMAGGDEAFKERVRLVGFALELGMKLTGDKEGVVFEFNHFNEFSIRGKAAQDEAGLFKTLAVGVVEFVAMPVAFVDEKCAVEMAGQGAHDQLTWLRAEAHGPAFF